MTLVAGLRKWTLILLGSTLLLAGALTFWLPLPIGLPLMLLGLPLILRYSPTARRWLTAAFAGSPTLRRQLARIAADEEQT